MKTELTLEGLPEMKASFKKYAKEHPDCAIAALYQRAQQIMGESAKEVPVKTGRLMNSRYVGLPEGTGKETTIDLGYGTNYGIYVHEMPGYIRADGRKSRFLLDPLMRAVGTWYRDMLVLIKRNIDRGITMASTPKFEGKTRPTK